MGEEVDYRESLRIRLPLGRVERADLALVFFAISMALPAGVLDRRLYWGYEMAETSLLQTGVRLVAGPSHFALLMTWQGLAATLGAIANLTFVVAWAAVRLKPLSGGRLALKGSAVAFVTAWLCILPIFVWLFVPHLGWVSWCGAFYFLWTAPRAGDRAPSSRTYVALAVVLGVGLGGGYLVRHDLKRREAERKEALQRIDAGVKKDIAETLAAHLAAVDEELEVYAHYGPFVELTDVRISRPSYGWMLVARLDFSAMAEFERARARVSLGVTGGELGIERLDAPIPGTKAIERDRDGELWSVGDSSRTRLSFDGWAHHPDFVWDD